MKEQRQRRFSLTRHKHWLWALPAFGFLLIAAVWAATWEQAQSTRRALMTAATHDTESLAAEFEQYTLRAIGDADRTTRLVKHEFEKHGVLKLSELIRSGLFESSELAVVSVADANGDNIARSQPASPFNIADREYFRLHSERDTGVLDISKPVVGRASGNSRILFSRRLNRADGSFAGIVALSVTPEYFMQFYQESELGAQGSLGLLGLDGTSRARRVGSDATALPDESVPALAALAKTDPVGHFEARGAVDHVMRIVAYRKLAGYPFIVTAGRATDEVLADFHKDLKNYLTVAAAASIAILAFFAIITVLAIRLQRHRGELKVQRQFLETLVDNIPAGIAVRSMQPGALGQFVLWSESNEIIFGRKAEDALGKTIRDVMPPANVAEVVDLDRQLLESPMVQEVEQVRDVPGKGRRIIHLIRAPIFGADGQVDFIMSSATDITRERARNDELRLASKVFETTADGIMMSDSDDRVVMVNAAFTKLTGYGAQEIVGKTLAESPFRPIDVPESDARMDQLHRDGYVTGEVPRFRKDGVPLSLWVTASCVRNGDGTIRNYVRVFTDISLLKETQQKLEQLASFDALTGLPNRRLLHDRLEQALLRAKRHHGSMALMFIDLDGFKEINDTLGHDIGDLLLREVAIRLASCIRASDSIGRFGGDEFAIVLEDASLPSDAEQIGARIVAAFVAPFDLADNVVRMAASVGIAIYPSDGVHAAALLKNADVAMYAAKRNGRNRFEFFATVVEPEAAVE